MQPVPFESVAIVQHKEGKKRKKEQVAETPYDRKSRTSRKDVLYIEPSSMRNEVRGTSKETKVLSDINKKEIPSIKIHRNDFNDWK